MQSFERAQRHHEKGYEAYALRLLGDIEMHHEAPNMEKAEIHYRQALALSDKLAMRPLQAHCRRSLGALYNQTGQTDKSYAELSTAIEMYRDMKMTFWLPEAEATLAVAE